MTLEQDLELLKAQKAYLDFISTVDVTYGFKYYPMEAL